MSERFMITAGGTGGHVFPALALAKALRDKGQEPFIVTDKRGARYVDADLASYIVRAASPSGGLINKAQAVIDLLVGTFQSWQIAGHQQPAAAAAFGGYASFPAAIAARLRAVPMLLHEQNAVFGRANRALARFARLIALSYPETQAVPQNGTEQIVTGNPVRPGFSLPASKQTHDDQLHLVILGGSQGARVLSDALPGAIIALPDQLRSRLVIAQQCRAEDLERVQNVYDEAGMAVELATFFEDVPARMANADLMITRSGASTIAELTACACPAVLIPYLHASDAHQEANAKRLAEAGAAIMIRQPEVSIEGMTETLSLLLSNPARLQAMRDAMGAQAKPDAADQLAEAMLLLARRRRGG